MRIKKMWIYTMAGTLLLAGSTKLVTKADNEPKSQGRLYYNNNTADTSDDVLFEAGDLHALHRVLTQTEQAVDELSTKVENGKQELIYVINTYPGEDVPEDSTLPELAEAVEALTVFPENTFFFVEDSQGRVTERYKIIGGGYYPCDENGVVTEGAGAVDVTGKALQPYTAMNAANLSAGAGGFVNKLLILGSGGDNASAYNQGFVDGQKNVTANLDISYVYHSHRETCKNTCTGTYRAGNSWMENNGVTFFSYSCNICGEGAATDNYGAYTGWLGKTCGRVTYICGKNEGEIESATINY